MTLKTSSDENWPVILMVDPKKLFPTIIYQMCPSQFFKKENKSKRRKQEEKYFLLSERKVSRNLVLIYNLFFRNCVWSP